MQRPLVCDERTLRIAERQPSVAENDQRLGERPIIASAGRFDRVDALLGQCCGGDVLARLELRLRRRRRRLAENGFDRLLGRNRAGSIAGERQAGETHTDLPHESTHD